MKRWYEFQARAKGTPEIVIYDEIGAFGIPAKAFLDDLKALGTVEELTLRLNSPGGSVFDGVAIYNALSRHQAAITVWIDGIAASIASMVAMAGDEIVMPENAMLMIHDPSGVVLGTASDMRAMAEALDKMKAGMVAAYRDKSGRDEAEIEAIMAAETWLAASEAVDLGFADRVEQPVRMAAYFDLSRFHKAPPQLAATTTDTIPQEERMPEPKKPRSSRKSSTVQAEEVRAEANTNADQTGSGQPDSITEPVEADAALEHVPERQPASADTVAQSTAQVIDLAAVRAEERRATLAYVTEVHEICALASRSDLAAGFIAKATDVTSVRRARLEARAADDEASAIQGQVRTAVIEPPQPAIDTAAIYAARNQNAH